MSGSREQAFAAADAYGVEVSATYAADTPGIDYSMNHSAFTYLVGRDGQLRSMYREGIDGETMAAAIRRHLDISKITIVKAGDFAGAQERIGIP